MTNYLRFVVLVAAVVLCSSGWAGEAEVPAAPAVYSKTSATPVVHSAAWPGYYYYGVYYGSYRWRYQPYYTYYASPWFDYGVHYAPYSYGWPSYGYSSYYGSGPYSWTWPHYGAYGYTYYGPVMYPAW